jgi:hypothetical protein
MLSEQENVAVLTRLVAHFERQVEEMERELDS